MELQPDSRALYVISVAAELAGVHPQTLRIYERRGLIEPARTEGGSRRYSDQDIKLLRRVQELTQAGVGLAGVQRILQLEAELDRVRMRLERAERRLADAEGDLDAVRRRGWRGSSAALVPRHLFRFDREET